MRVRVFVAFQQNPRRHIAKGLPEDGDFPSGTTDADHPDAASQVSRLAMRHPGGRRDFHRLVAMSQCFNWLKGRV
jgi:hypothetical protein